MGFGFRGNIFKKLEKIFLKFFPQKAIKKGIQAVVKISYADGDGHGSVHDICDSAVVNDPQLNQHIQESEYLVGNPGEEKEKHNCHNDLKNIIISWLVLLNLVSLLEGLPNKSVACKNDQKGK